MLGHPDQLAIRSRYGMLRDLVPIYSLYQLLINVVVLGTTFCILGSPEQHKAAWLFVLFIGWAIQFASRPSSMDVRKDQAGWLEALLDQEPFYYRCEKDGRWRKTGRYWWQSWPHQFIAFLESGESVTLLAPRDVLDSIRNGLEILDDHGTVHFASDRQPFSFEAPEPAELTWKMHAPAALLGTACVLAWIAHLPFGGMAGWGVSGLALSQGRFQTILLHMFAHGGAAHLLMNMTALAALGGPLVARLGAVPWSWVRFLALFFLSGLAGAALYLAFHPAGTVPMVGASGALYGLGGVFIRAPAAGTGELLSLRSTKIRRIAADLVKQNMFLFALLALMSWNMGVAGGLAWEAHLGGFLFGLFAAPKLLKPMTASNEMSHGSGSLDPCAPPLPAGAAEELHAR